MAKARKIKASEIVKDIGSGMSNAELMEKYAITAGALRDLFRRLIEAGLLKLTDLTGSQTAPPAPSEEEPAGSPAPAAPSTKVEPSQLTKPETPRPSKYFPLMQMPIYELEDLTTEYVLDYFTEKGIKISGITARVGDRKTFMVQPDEFADVFPFVFEAVCRWVDKDPESKVPTAGFDITSISKTGFDELSKLILAVTIPEGEE